MNPANKTEDIQETKELKGHHHLFQFTISLKSQKTAHDLHRWIGQSRTRAKEAHTAGAYRGFRSMKQLRVLLLPLDGMIVHRRVTPPVVCHRYPFIHLDGERQ